MSKRIVASRGTCLRDGEKESNETTPSEKQGELYLHSVSWAHGVVVWEETESSTNGRIIRSSSFLVMMWLYLLLQIMPHYHHTTTTGIIVLAVESCWRHGTVDVLFMDVVEWDHRCSLFLCQADKTVSFGLRRDEVCANKYEKSHTLKLIWFLCWIRNPLFVWIISSNLGNGCSLQKDDGCAETLPRVSSFCIVVPLSGYLFTLIWTEFLALFSTKLWQGYLLSPTIAAGRHGLEKGDSNGKQWWGFKRRFVKNCGLRVSHQFDSISVWISYPQ